MRNLALKNLAAGLIFAASAGVAFSQWVAFNDHYTNATLTHINATAWNVFGTAGGAPGNAGPLKNITNGAVLPVTLTITNRGVTGGTSAAGPAVGTPAYNTFNGYVHFGSGSVNHAIQIGPGQVMAHVFTGLNPQRRYRFAGTAIRGNTSYTNRWIRIELYGAESFQNAHSANVLTAAQVGLTNLAANEAAFNSGVNHTETTGDIVAWEEIDPGSDGMIIVYSRQYTGLVPGGSSAGTYGYGLSGLRLEEVRATPPSIVDQPDDTAVCSGQSVSFSVQATGSQPLRYQWLRNGAILSGETNPVYTVLSATSPADYSVIVTNLAGSVTSRVAHLTVANVAVSFTAQPTNTAVPVDTPATFYVTVSPSSSQPIYYQWYRNTVANNTSGTPIPGATGPNFTITAYESNLVFYYVVATNCFSSRTSQVASLGAIYVPASITTQPQDNTVLEGANVTLSVVAAGSKLHYQWYKSGAPAALGTPIPNATNAALNLFNVRATDSGFYKVLVTNAVSAVLSSNAILIVNQQPYLIVNLTNHYWRYNQQGQDLGTAWRAVTYTNEASWPSGRGVLAWEDNAQIRPITNTVLSLTAPPPATNRIITYYFRTTFVLTNDPATITLLTSNLFDDGMVLYINGVEAFRTNMPTGNILYSTRPLGTLTEPAWRNIEVSGSMLVEGTNTLAAEVHQINDTSSDIVFGMAAFVSFPTPSFLEVTNQPKNVIVEEGKTAVFTVGHIGFPAWYQWYKWSNDAPVAVPGATKQTLTLTNVLVGVDDGWYFCVLSNLISITASSNALLTIVPDTNAPVLIDADGTVNWRDVILSFNETVSLGTNNPATALTNVANYTITNTFGESLTIIRAAFTNGTNVILTTSTDRQPDRNYIATVKSVTDVARVPNTATNISCPISTYKIVVRDVDNYDFVQPIPGLDDTNRFANDSWRQLTYDPYNDPWVWSWGPGVSAFYLGPVEIPVPLGSALSQNTVRGSYFRKKFTFNGSPAGLQVQMRHVTDDGAVFYLNNLEITRFNMPAGWTHSDTAALGDPDPIVMTDYFDIPSSLLRYGTNLFAMELHFGEPNELDAALAAEIRARIDSVVVGKALITSHPTNVTVFENDPAYFTFKGVAGLTFQWKSNGVAVAGATNPVLIIPNTPLSANTSRWSVVVNGLTNSVESAQALLRVIPDTNAPVLLSAYLTGSDTITLTFSEPVQPASATNVANYAITNAIGPNLNLVSITLTNGSNALVRVSSVPPGNYTVVASHVYDRATVPNVIATNSRVTLGLYEVPLIALDAATMWKYNQQAVDLGTAWRALNYNDSGTEWSNGPALFGFETAALPEPIRSPLIRQLAGASEITRTYYFRTKFTVPIFGPGALMSVRTVLDDGAIFHLNGQTALSIGVPLPAYYSTLANRTVDNAVYEGPFNIPTTNVFAGTNILAVEAHQVSVDSSDLIFGTWLYYSLPSLVLPAGGPVITHSTNRPYMFITRQGQNIRVSWTNPEPFTLQYTRVFNPPSTGWTNVSPQPVGMEYITPATNAPIYFRLRWPAP